VIAKLYDLQSPYIFIITSVHFMGVARMIAMMNYVENFDILEKKVKQIPCITGQGAPSTVDGAVGMLYIDTDSGLVYKCTSVSVDGFVWKDITAEYNQALKALSEQVNDLSEELGAIAQKPLVQIITWEEAD
jgi:hypothetical protein